jgi:hypothetical protein
MDQIIDAVRGLDGVLVLTPGPDSGFPDLAWGDAFFYFAPDGRIPANTQPYGTIVTKDYPDDTLSQLGRDGRWRVNIHAGRARTAEASAQAGEDPDFAAVDVILPHPLYAAQGWIAVVMPGERTLDEVIALLREAHDAARARAERRAAAASDG